MKTKMLLVAGALVLGGCAAEVTGTPHAAKSVVATDVRSGAESAFLYQLHQRHYPGISDPSVRRSAVEVGHAVCDVYDAGGNQYGVYAGLIEGGSTATLAPIMIVAATTHLCPEYKAG